MDKDEFPHIGGVLTTNMVMEENHPVCFMYRESPNLTQDSGWRLLSGLETQDYADNSGNWAYYVASSIVKRDPTLANLLLNPPGFAFERRSNNDDWYEVDDFDFEEEIIISKLDQNWSIQISDLFYKHIQDEDTFVFAMKGKTVRLMFWNHEGRNKIEIKQDLSQTKENQEADESPILEKIELNDESMLRIGFITQESDEKKSYKVLNCSSIVDGESAMIAIYFDRDEDKDWAIETWKGITYQK